MRKVARALVGAIAASLVAAGTRFQIGHSVSVSLPEVPISPAAQMAAVTIRVCFATTAASASPADAPERFAVRRVISTA